MILYLSFCRQSCLFYQGQSSCGVATTTGPGLSDLAAVTLGSVLLHFLKSVVLVACLRNGAFGNVKVWVSNPILEVLHLDGFHLILHNFPHGGHQPYYLDMVGGNNDNHDWLIHAYEKLEPNNYINEFIQHIMYDP